MRKLVLLFVALFTIAFVGCDNDSNPTGSGLGGDGGTTGGGSVTFQVGTTQGQNGGINFTFKPSQNVTVTSITVNLPAQNFTDPIQGDDTTVYDTQTGFYVGEYNGVASGQQWTFNIVGKIGSATGQAYNVNVNYTIP